jgi:hypothetical protein
LKDKNRDANGKTDIKESRQGQSRHHPVTARCSPLYVLILGPLPADFAVLNHDIGCDRLPFQEPLLKNSISSCPGEITQYLRFQRLCPAGMA